MSKIFDTELYLKLQVDIKNLLNGYGSFLSKESMDSPRAAGDAIESILRQNLETLLGEVCASYSASFARRSMADIAFTDTDGYYYAIDVKTHRTDTKFNMPNLTSVERLSRFYDQDTNIFCLLIVSYIPSTTGIQVADVVFIPIEYLDWSCLTIGALGWGQIQIANANKIVVKHNNQRELWMIELCEKLLIFYGKELEKISKRSAHFEKLLTQWKNRIE